MGLFRKLKRFVRLKDYYYKKYGVLGVDKTVDGKIKIHFNIEVFIEMFDGYEIIQRDESTYRLTKEVDGVECFALAFTWEMERYGIGK